MENIKISGSGVIPSGTYDEVKVAGNGKIVGDITCSTLKCAGNLIAEENISAKLVTFSGKATIKGNMECTDIKVSGFAEFSKTVTATHMRIRGSVIVEGDLNVDVLDAKLGKSTFKNIYGDNIHIKNEGLFGLVTATDRVILDEIEATTINVDSIKANRVSGRDVYINGESIIDVVEYSEHLTISKYAKVNEIIKL